MSKTIKLPIELKVVQESQECAKAALKDLSVADNPALFFSFFKEEKAVASGTK
jgi:hypothetical protein